MKRFKSKLGMVFFAVLALVGALGVVNSAPASAAYEPTWGINNSFNGYVQMEKCVANRAGQLYWEVRFRHTYYQVPGAVDLQLGYSRWDPFTVARPPWWHAAPAGWNVATLHMDGFATGSFFGGWGAPLAGRWYLFRLAPGAPEPTGVNSWMPAYGDTYLNTYGPGMAPPWINSWKASSPNTTACAGGAWWGGNTTIASSWF